MLKVIFRLLLGFLVFVAINLLIFNSGFYFKYLQPDSAAGWVYHWDRYEKDRTSNSQKDILVLGDSRVVNGFSARVADELAFSEGYKFFNAAVSSTALRSWYYQIRDLDPKGNRYRAVVVPVTHYDLKGDAEDYNERVLDIQNLSPLLGASDLRDFAFSFSGWVGRVEAVKAILLRAFALRGDLIDFIWHPRARLAALRARRDLGTKLGYDYVGEQGDLSGLKYDGKEITFPQGLSEGTMSSLNMVLKGFKYVPQPEAEQRYFKTWLGRIFEHYKNTGTTVLVLELPFGPLPPVIAPYEKGTGVVWQLAKNFPQVKLFEEDTFHHLESPENYYDGLHLNTKGRELFTKSFVDQVKAQLSERVADAL